jgi:hypothetical protein
MGDKSWEELRSENPVNDHNAALYDRMIACEVTPTRCVGDAA